MLNLKRRIFNLECDYSKVKSISLYINQLRDFITIIQKYPNIINIDLEKNIITEYEQDIIDLLQTTRIKALNISNINKENIIPLLYVIGKGLINNKHLKKLYLMNADNLYIRKLNLKDEDEEFEKKDKQYKKSINLLISKNMNLTKYNILYDEFFVGLNLSNLNYLNLNNNNINDDFLNILCENISNNNSIEYLLLNDNKIESIKGISNLLIRNKTLKFLSLIKNCIINLDELEEAFKVNQSLISIYLSNNPINNIIPLCKGLKTNKTLTHLHLEECDINNIDCFDDLLKSNTKIEYINLRNNEIKKINKFCKGLYFNTKLEYLNLGFNNLINTDELGNVLMYNKSIKYLILENNKINNIDLLVNSLNTNTTLTYLDIGYNYIENINNLCDVLKTNTTLTDLCICNNYFENLKPISEMLKINSSLITLHLGFKIPYLKYKFEICNDKNIEQFSHNDFKDFDTLIEALKVNKGLICLNLNGDTSPNIQNLYQMLEYNTTLTNLQLINLKEEYNHNITTIKELPFLNNKKNNDLNIYYPNSPINKQFLNALEKNYTLTSIYY